uniref:Uncharacterized protein n=1 Tax=Cryptomonas curvata TaxID=233186 RepID=A0A7S0N274_9CRYP
MRQPPERPVSSMTNSAVLCSVVFTTGSSSPPCQLQPNNPLALLHVRTCLWSETDTPLEERLLKLSCTIFHHSRYNFLWTLHRFQLVDHKFELVRERKGMILQLII